MLVKEDCLESIRKTIEDTKLYTAHLDAIDRWEAIKIAMQKDFKKLSRRAASEDTVAISQLTEKVTEMENQLEDLTEEQQDVLHDSKDELENLLNKKVRGIMFRTKAKWQMEGERNTKYFYNLEKTKYNAKTCTKLFNTKNEIICNPAAIMKMQKDYYQELYTADENSEFVCEVEIDTVVTEECGLNENQFTMEEMKDAVKQLKNGSCPGSDGLPIEVYKILWRELHEPLYEAVCLMYAQERIHTTGKLGVLNLIPKGDKDTRYLKNMRPITLLNSDYKVIEKMVANRLIPALQIVIHEDQKGFLPGRRISANIRKVLDIMTETAKSDTPGMLLQCDFLKCFR